MNAQPKTKSPITLEAYLENERSSNVRHEYFNGETFAMTGGSLNHNQINGNIFNQLKNRLKGSSCRPFASDMRVKVDALNKYTYPDIVVVCGDIQLEKIKGVESLINPVAIIEVLSDSTEAYDRGDKFTHYRMIPSLREYLLVSQKKCQIDQYIRSDGGIWQILNPHTDRAQSIEMPFLHCDLSLSEVYDWVEFETMDDDR